MIVTVKSFLFVHLLAGVCLSIAACMTRYWLFWTVLNPFSVRELRSDYPLFSTCCISYIQQTSCARSGPPVAATKSSECNSSFGRYAFAVQVPTSLAIARDPAAAVGHVLTLETLDLQRRSLNPAVDRESAWATYMGNAGLYASSIGYVAKFVALHVTLNCISAGLTCRVIALSYMTISVSLRQFLRAKTRTQHIYSRLLVNRNGVSMRYRRLYQPPI